MAKQQKRAKSSEPLLIPVNDWGHANEMIGRIGKLQRQIETKQNQAQERIDKTKAACVRAVGPLQEKIDLNVMSLQAFAQSNQEEFGKARSRKLDYGTLGWRKATSIRVGKRTKELIKRLFLGTKKKQCLHITETVSKTGLAQLTDEQLKRIEARREVTDDFFVEPDRFEAADQPAGG